MKQLFNVYRHTCPNGKVYIGITCKNPSSRWAGGHGYKKNLHFHNAILKYGWDNIKHEILFTDLTKEEACEKEIELIAKYKSNNPEFGYNVAAGGRVNFGFHHSEETKRKISINGKGKHCGKFDEHRKRNIAFGTKKAMTDPTIKIKLSEEARKRTGNKSTHRRSVVNLDTNERFISVREASSKYCVSESYLAAVCRGIKPTAKGYHWAYESEVT